LEDLPEGSRFLPKPYNSDHVASNLKEIPAAWLVLECVSAKGVYVEDVSATP